MTVRLGSAIAFAQIGVVGFDGQIELEAVRLHGLPEAAPALLRGTQTLPAGQREFAAGVPLDPPSLPGGATHLVDVTVTGARATVPRHRSPLRRASSNSPARPRLRRLHRGLRLPGPR
jgi:hypothetical protein